MRDMPENRPARPPAAEHDAPGAATPPRATLGREAFAARYEANARVLWCIAAAVLGGRRHVEDVLQESAVIALKKLEQFDPDTSFVAWMGQIVRFVALNQGRKLGRSKTTSVDPELMQHHAAAGSDGTVPAPVTSNGRVVADQTSFDDRVLAALRTLDETARACLLLRTVTGRSYREISLAMDIPEGTAMSHVHRARRAMRRMLGGDSDSDGQGAQGTHE